MASPPEPARSLTRYHAEVEVAAFRKKFDALKNSVAARTRRRYRPALIPLKGVRGTEDDSSSWEALDDSPQFQLTDTLPGGWVEASWVAGSLRPIRLRLNLDRGEGFKEEERVDLGTVLGERPQKQRAVVFLPGDVKQARLELFVTGEPEKFYFDDLVFTRVGLLGMALRAAGGFWGRSRGPVFSKLAILVRKAVRIARKQGLKSLLRKGLTVLDNERQYQIWLNDHSLTIKDIERIKSEIAAMSHQPLISVLVPVYNTEERWLRRCIETVMDQFYPNWELCIADDASTATHVREVLKEYAAKDERIKLIFRSTNGHISAALNSALELATGEFVALLDHDDELAPEALFEVVKLLNQHPDTDMIYSDEDKVDEDGRRYLPYFKPDWSPELFLSQMYTCHLGVYRTELVRQIGGFRVGLEGSQDYDFVLRLTEKTDRIGHIPKVLYHWRSTVRSTSLDSGAKPYAQKAALQAIKDALERRGVEATVTEVEELAGCFRVHYALVDRPLISIVIPTRDMADVLGRCLKSVFEQSTYENFEIVVVDNGSKEERTRELLDAWQQKEPERFRVVRLDIPFNYSRLNNYGVSSTRGSLVVLLNNDTEVITPDWMEEMAGYAQREEIGAVGAVLLYPDTTIQHAGVVLGLGGVAGHPYRGAPQNSTGYFGRLLVPSNVAAVTGACMMIKKSLYEAVGGLDEQLGVAYNDVDFCIKVMRQGYRNVLLPHVRLIHHEYTSRGHEDTPEKKARYEHEVNTMQKRWGELLQQDPYYNPNLTLDREDYSLRI